MKAMTFFRMAMPLAVVLLAACSGPTTRYYSLAETAPPATATASTAKPGAAPLFIELAPLSVPERLARPQMVVRQKDGADAAQVAVLEQHRWASSFDSELRDALGSAIAGRLGAVDGTKTNRPRGQPAVRIAVQVNRFDAVVDSRIDAAFSWTLRRTEDGPSAGCQLGLAQPIGTGMEAVAQGARAVASQLADAIAASVKAQQAGQTPPCAAPAA